MSMILECQLAEHISFPLEIFSVAGVESLHCYPRLRPLENEISYTLIIVRKMHVPTDSLASRVSDEPGEFVQAILHYSLQT
jgi:hypothetical protein